MVRRILLFLALLVPLALASAQEEEPPDEGEPPEGETFPVSLLFEAAETAASGGPLWRPDWPPDVPPDAFTLRGRKEGALRVEVSILPADSPDQRVYCFSRDREGWAEAFPFLLGRELFQAEFSYHGEPGGGGEPGSRPLVAAAALTGPEGTDSLNLEVLEWEETRPSLIRVLWGERYSFVLIQKRPGGILETWYDPEGRLFEACDFTTAPQAGGDRIVSSRLRGKDEETRYYYDSRGLVTGVSGPLGDFSVLYYREDLPRYWDYRPAASAGEAADLSAPRSYSLRWDETPLLLGFSGKTPGEDLNSVDCRYAYTPDEHGGWIERRETRMIRRLGLLVPFPGTAIKRVLDYGGEGEGERGEEE